MYQYMIFFVYAVLLFLVLRFSVTLFNFLSNPKLGYYGKRFTDKVSIIILSSRAGEDLSVLLASIEAQDYQNLEVIIKKHSETERRAIATATGSYLLFLDANTVVGKGLINNLICRTKVFNLDLLSLIPNHQLKGFLSKLIYPLNDFVLMNLLPLRLVRLSSEQTFATANTACMFFKTDSYKEHSWYEKVEGRRTRSIEITKLMKQMKLKTEVLLANRFIYSRDDLGVNRVSDQLLLIFGNNIPAALIYLLLVVAGPVVMLCNFNAAFIGLPLGLIFLSRIMISFLTAQNPFINVLLHPIQMLMLLALMLNGLWRKVLTSVKHKR